MEQQYTELKKAIQTQMAMSAYRDCAYVTLINQINTKAAQVLKDDMGSQFVQNCGRDLAGEVIRNFFDTSNYYITVDQLAMRILKFSYENEYDPLADNGGMGEIQKSVYNYNELTSAELDKISADLDEHQQKLFEKEKVWNEKQQKFEDKYIDRGDIQKGKDAYFERRKNDDGTVNDEYTGKQGEYIVDKNGKRARRQQVDHVQALATAKYNSKYLTEEGKKELKDFYNSSDNFAMMDSRANQSKNDVQVFDKDGNDITHRATPEQLANAVCERWENAKSEETRKELHDKGYLNEDGTVPKAVRKKLESNYRHSQNKESEIILENTNYKEVAQDAKEHTKAAIGQIIAGQIIYYAAPPLLYEIRCLLSNKKAKLDDVLGKLGEAAKRIGSYVLSKLKDIFKNVLFNSLKKFVKSFMDILIGSVKATVKKLLKIAKNLVLSTVDAVRIIVDKNTTAAEKADSVVNLFGVTITSCVIEVLFELAAEYLHIPEPFDDIIFGPLQILTTVVCTNLTMLILQKADLFDVRFGFKINAVKKIFEEDRIAYEAEMTVVEQYTQKQVERIISMAKEESIKIYEDLQELDPKRQPVHGQLEHINRMFSMNIDFNADWLHFLGVDIAPQPSNSI